MRLCHMRMLLLPLRSSVVGQLVCACLLLLYILSIFVLFVFILSLSHPSSSSTSFPILPSITMVGASRLKTQ